MTRLALVLTAVAVAGSVAPASAEVGCPRDWFRRGTGVYNPVTGTEVTYCWPMS